MQYRRSLLTTCIGFLVICLAFHGILGCGGMAAPVASVPLPSYSLTGSLSAPSETSSSISQLTIGAHAKYLVQIGHSASFSIYNISNPPAEGGAIATGTSDESGNFSVSVSTSAINAGDILVIQTEDGIAGFMNVPDTLDSASPMNIGSADFYSTITVQQLIDNLGTNGDWSQFDLDTVTINFDLDCLANMAAAGWQNVSLTGSEGVGVSLAMIESLLAAAFLNGDFGGYSSVGDLYQAILDGSVDDTLLQQIAELAASQYGGSASMYTEALDYAVVNYNAFSQTLASYYAGGTGVGDSDTTDGVTVATDSFCANSLTDSDYLTQALLVILEANDANILVETFASANAVELINSILNEFHTNGDWIFTGENLANTWNFEALSGMLQGVNGNLETFSAETFVNLLDQVPSGNDTFDYGNWGMGLGATYYSCHTESTSLSTEELTALSGYMAYQTASGVFLDVGDTSFASYDWCNNFQTEYTALMTDGYDPADCINDPAACENTFGSGYHLDDWQQYDPGTCDNDGVCDGTESYVTCPTECLTQYYADSGTYIGYTCGDAICSASESYYLCPADCAATSQTWCGDGSCNGDETCLTCSADCGNTSCCGDTLCSASETYTSCSSDCYCGNMLCSIDEDVSSCPSDCAVSLSGLYALTIQNFAAAGYEDSAYLSSCVNAYSSCSGYYSGSPPCSQALSLVVGAANTYTYSPLSPGNMNIAFVNQYSCSASSSSVGINSDSCILSNFGTETIPKTISVTMDNPGATGHHCVFSYTRDY